MIELYEHVNDLSNSITNEIFPKRNIEPTLETTEN